MSQNQVAIQVIFTCWKSTIETLEKDVKYVQMKMKEVVSMKNGSSKTSKQVKIMEMNDTQSRKIKET